MAMASPIKRMRSAEESPSKEDQCMNAINNNVLRVSPRRQAGLFAAWFRRLVDEDRPSLCLYLAEDATLQWFGRTITARKKVAGFLKYDMHCTSHRFTGVEVCGAFTVRGQKEGGEAAERKPVQPEEDKNEVLATPLNSDTPGGILNSRLQRFSLRSLSAKRPRPPSCSPPSPPAPTSAKKPRTMQVSPSHLPQRPGARALFLKEDKVEDATVLMEEGQGDCLPSTSSTEPQRKRSKETKDDFFLQLPHSYVELRCVIEFTKTRVKRGADILKWERQCKLQVAYTEDPVYLGEYIIWTIVYSDNNKCRRNLLAAFDAVSNECENNL